MDKKDLKILKILQTNVRQPYSKIAKKLEMTENAVKYRLKKMEHQGFIKNYQVNLSSSKFGKQVRVVFLMNVESHDFEESMKKLQAYKEFSTVLRCVGQYAIMCTGFFDNNEHLHKFLDKKLLAEIPIKSWIEHIVLKPYKETGFNVDMLD